MRSYSSEHADIRAKMPGSEFRYSPSACGIDKDIRKHLKIDESRTRPITTGQLNKIRQVELSSGTRFEGSTFFDAITYLNRHVERRGLKWPL